MEKNKIYNMDALEFLKGVESDSVDLIVTDPPYLMCSTGGGGICGKRRNYNYLYDESRKESFRDGNKYCDIAEQRLMCVHGRLF